jgi:hypothetical protein
VSRPDETPWIEVNLPWETYGDGPSFVELVGQILGLEVLLEGREKSILVGSINSAGGVCGCCEGFDSDVVVLRYRRVWEPTS